jgi:hypothetical protein
MPRSRLTASHSATHEEAGRTVTCFLKARALRTSCTPSPSRSRSRRRGGERGCDGEEEGHNHSAHTLSHRQRPGQHSRITHMGGCWRPGRKRAALPWRNSRGGGSRTRATRIVSVVGTDCEFAKRAHMLGLLKREPAAALYTQILATTRHSESLEVCAPPTRHSRSDHRQRKTRVSTRMSPGRTGPGF